MIFLGYSNYYPSLMSHSNLSTFLHKNLMNFLILIISGLFIFFLVHVGFTAVSNIIMCILDIFMWSDYVRYDLYSLGVRTFPSTTTIFESISDWDVFVPLCWGFNRWYPPFLLFYKPNTLCWLQCHCLS